MSEIMNLVNMVFKLGDWVNTITNFHIVMTLAVIGWIFSAKKSWPKGQRIIVIAVYAAFAAYNILSQYQTHHMLQIALNELNAAVSHSNAGFYTTDFRNLLEQNPGSNISLVIGGYVVGDFLMLLFIWFSYVWKKDEV